jgi:hypothetical protein
MEGITLDVFNSDPFNCVSLTDSINGVPFVPGRAGQVVGWEEEGVPTTTIMLEEDNGELKLINPTPRGGPGETSADSKRKARSLIVPHYQHDDTILADSVQNVRAFGTANVLEVLQDRVNAKLENHVRWKLDPTLEYQRVGAVKGIILNANGSTLYDLFAEFGVTQADEVNFDLANATPAKGALRGVCDDVDRIVADALGGVPYTGLHAFCSTEFWKDLIAHPEVHEVYLASQTMAMALLNPMAYKTIKNGNITFEEYRGKNGAAPFIAASKVHIFPVGVPGLWRTIYAPADYEETVNTNGLPRYAKQYPSPNGKGRHLESQMNAINYCTRPKVLVKGKRT